MMGKNLVFKAIIVLTFFILVIPLSSLTVNPQPYDPVEIPDQSQETGPFEQSVHSEIMLAQGFTPTRSPLTKVEIKLNKPHKTENGIFVSIRKDLNGSDLTSKVISATDIPYFVYWIEVDFSDIDVTPGEMYYIVLLSSTPSEQSYRWRFDYDEEINPYQNGSMYRSADDGDTWSPVESDFDFVDATFRTYTYDSHVDLVCNGFLNWTANVSKNESDPILLTGSFTVENVGTPLSKLDWEILSWPGWGTWEFSPMNQTGLQPEKGPTTVSVNVEGPSTNLPDTYDGKVIIRNKNNKNDSCIVRARLVTSKEKEDEQQESLFSMFLKSFLNKINDVTESIWMQPNDFWYLPYFFTNK